VRGKIHTPFCKLAEPASRNLRQTFTRRLEGVAGSCERNSSQSGSVIFNLLFKFLTIYYNRRCIRMQHLLYYNYLPDSLALGLVINGNKKEQVICS
jgi:hypothetical protein